MSQGRTYHESLWTPEDTDHSGLDFKGNFYGKEIAVETLTFSDGSSMISAGAGLPSQIDAGTF